MSAIRSILKKFRSLKKLQDEIVQKVTYIKNRTISWSANSITLYEGVNKVITFIAHLCLLGC